MAHYDIARRYVEYCENGEGKVSGKQGNVSYLGHRFISYGTSVINYHEPERVYLVDSRRYSASTSRHVRMVEGLASLYSVFAVPDIYNPTAQANIDYMVYRISEELGRITRARLLTGTSVLHDTVDTLGRYCATFNVPYPGGRLQVNTLLNNDRRLVSQFVRRRLVGEIGCVNLGAQP